MSQTNRRGLRWSLHAFLCGAGALGTAVALSVFNLTSLIWAVTLCGVVLWWAAAMLVALFQRDKTTLVAGGVLGGLYGPGYLVSALWCYGYSWDAQYIDWWKMWELFSGLILGAYYVVVLNWVTG